MQSAPLPSQMSGVSFLLPPNVPQPPPSTQNWPNLNFPMVPNLPRGGPQANNLQSSLLNSQANLSNNSLLNNVNSFSGFPPSLMSSDALSLLGNFRPNMPTFPSNAGQLDYSMLPNEMSMAAFMQQSQGAPVNQRPRPQTHTQNGQLLQSLGFPPGPAFPGFNANLNMALQAAAANNGQRQAGGPFATGNNFNFAIPPTSGPTIASVPPPPAEPAPAKRSKRSGSAEGRSEGKSKKSGSRRVSTASAGDDDSRTSNNHTLGQYFCHFPDCNEVLRSRFSLKRHIKKHTGERPFLCPYNQCGKSFPESSTLKRHIRIHTGEKPYRCRFPGCTKAFADATNVKRHEITHTGEKPYRCPVVTCARMFSRGSSLKQHMVTLHSMSADDPEIIKAIRTCITNAAECAGASAEAAEKMVAEELADVDNLDGKSSPGGSKDEKPLLSDHGSVGNSTSSLPLSVSVNALSDDNISTSSTSETCSSTTSRQSLADAASLAAILDPMTSASPSILNADVLERLKRSLASSAVAASVPGATTVSAQ